MKEVLAGYEAVILGDLLKLEPIQEVVLPLQATQNSLKLYILEGCTLL